MNAEEVAIELTNHNDRLEVVEKGVSNFRNFQSDMKGKLGFVYGATWVAGIVGVVILSVFGWMLTMIAPAAKIIVDDYYHNHPAAKLQQHSILGPVPLEAYSGFKSETATEDPSERSQSW
jgi:hypothetical protein